MNPRELFDGSHEPTTPHQQCHIGYSGSVDRGTTNGRRLNVGGFVGGICRWNDRRNEIGRGDTGIARSES